MCPTRRLPLHVLAAGLALAAPLAAPFAAAPAQAQNFFERLFGIKPERPPVPPRGVPEGAPAAPAAPAEPGTAAPEAPRAPPAPRGPVVLKAPAEESVLGQDLQLNGLAGTLKLERSGGAVTARVKLPGTKISQPTESCTVPLAGGNPIPLTAEGKPEGVPRYEAAAAECPLRFDLTEGAVLVSTLGSGPVCTFSAADCATTPAGMWGPAAATLIPRAGEFDAARGVADKAVRDNYKVMTQRARREDMRPIVTEQAAFSADREQLCRTYAREGAHGFCHLRVTENRSLSLATRLGANTAAPTAAAAPRKPRPKPAVEGMNPDAAGGGPAAE
ncbi:hypothetical protein Q8W71_08850 [Methylobacterium sp. NEAU 140]|uniref:hypothetical protein n=1 Tax=Methylobacterium sp. NEAU 140 TaxID=3064945 RepID=UPI002734B3BB|nr:hypothetical protein [Methylobacterium sp. NEAU 140]MDP4022729.1 hypothetical protein [Methylobacterium sp. NEAU 140]